MASEKGVTLKVSGGEAEVAVNRREACAKCGACSVGKGDMTLTVVNECGAGVGDEVIIEMKSSLLTKAVIIMYAMPLALFMAGILAGYAGATLIGLLRYREIIAFCAGAVSLVGAGSIIRLNEKRADRSRYTPVATKILRRDGEPRR
ncbi:MAG: SoxR reducing system RseC family protein [Clostridiales bacterium]|nr:SoxR reducing system RseC family protein [Clostridiales bacterium]